MKDLLIKILFSAFALLLSFIFKIDIVKKILLILPIIVLLENTIKEAIKKIKQKDFINEYILILISSIMLIISNELTILLEALLFFSLKDYLYYTLVYKNKNKIIKEMRKEKEIVSIKTPSGLIKIPLNETKVGDILYLEKNTLNQVEGILISEDNSYITKNKEIKVSSLSYIPSGVYIKNDALIKIKRKYDKSSYYIISNLLEKTEENKNIKSTLKIESKINNLLLILSLAATIILFKTDLTKIIKIESSLIFLIEIESLKRYENMLLFNYIYKLLKEDIYLTKENILENLTKIKNIVFSKEGVLTKKQVELSKIVPVYQTKEEILTKAVYAEYGQVHPYAKAISNYYKIEVNQDKIFYQEEIKGKGVRAIVDGEEIYIGSTILFDELNITYPKIDFQTPTCLIAINKTYAGTFVFQSNIKEDIYLTSSLLREEKVEKIVLMSSLEKEQVKKIGNRLSMNESYAELTLEEKAKVLNMYKNSGKTLYVDAYKMDEVLRENSDMTVLLGSDLDLNSADIILPNEDINDIVKLIKLAKKKKKNDKYMKLFFYIIKLVFFILILLQLTDIHTVSFMYLLAFLTSTLIFLFNI